MLLWKTALWRGEPNTRNCEKPRETPEYRDGRRTEHAVGPFRSNAARLGATEERAAERTFPRGAWERGISYLWRLNSNRIDIRTSRAHEKRTVSVDSSSVVHGTYTERHCNGAWPFRHPIGAVDSAGRGERTAGIGSRCPSRQESERP